jgi:formylglycine-generating enzyme required for sulfatase activity
MITVLVYLLPQIIRGRWERDFQNGMKTIIELYIYRNRDGKLIEMCSQAKKGGDGSRNGDGKEYEDVIFEAETSAKRDLRTVTNVIDMQMLWVEPGSFLMGSPPWEKDYFTASEEQHKVTLTQGYWLGKYEVTQEEYEKVMGSNPSNFKGAGRRAPVEGVSWYEAMEFCRKLTGLDRNAGKLPEGHEYRLPTEAQWEYACRAGKTRSLGRESVVNKFGWHEGNSGNSTHPVGQKKANDWGFLDMQGNVWEWCYDTYPSGRELGTLERKKEKSKLRVIRGGALDLPAWLCRPASRFGVEPEMPAGFRVGFRVACVVYSRRRQQRSPVRVRSSVYQ